MCMRALHLLLVGTWLTVAACGGSTSTNPSAGGAGGGGSGGAGGSSGGAGGSGASSNLAQCSAPGTCTLFATNCCGGYCDANAPLAGFQAVNVAKLGELEAQTCTGDIACPGCVSVDNPNYLAACRAGQCAAVDLRQDALSACAKDDDCRLRWGSGCCEDCGGNANELVVYSTSANLEAEVCNPGGGACPPCAPPPYPPYILPLCGEDKHCRYTVVGP